MYLYKVTKLYWIPQFLRSPYVFNELCYLFNHSVQLGINPARLRKLY